MLNKRTMKVISIVAMAMMLIMMISSVVFAASGMIPDADTGNQTAQTVKGIGGQIYGIFAAIGATVAVVILVWLGIKYVMASPDGKAEIKKQAFGYILGAALIFGASTILPAIVNFVTGAIGGN